MKTLKMVTIVGARPQFIKSAPVSRALRNKGHQEIMVHTGQHYDDDMSNVFFNELGLQKPDINLAIASSTHGRQTGEMLIGIEEVLQKQNPNYVLVYGDTNSTLAGALAASKLNITLIHIEAGLRSFNRRMAEEKNRVLTDHASSLLFCPCQTAVDNLSREGIIKNVYNVGDVMYDSLLHNMELAEKTSTIQKRLELRPDRYALATIHRAENTDNPERLKSIFYTLEKIAKEGLSIIISLHPRTRKKLDTLGLWFKNLRLIKPVSYLDMILLEKYAQVILTDSGGMQKEAFWLKVPCVTLRDETEWKETLASGWNVLAGHDPNRIRRAIMTLRDGSGDRNHYGIGQSAAKIVDIISSEGLNVQLD